MRLVCLVRLLRHREYILLVLANLLELVGGLYIKLTSLLVFLGALSLHSLASSPPTRCFRLSHHGQHGDPLHTESDAQFAHLCDMVVLMLAQLDSSFSELIHWKNVLLDNLLPPNVQV